MINCCIEKKRLREGVVTKTSLPEGVKNRQNDDKDDEQVNIDSFVWVGECVSPLAALANH